MPFMENSAPETPPGDGHASRPSGRRRGIIIAASAIAVIAVIAMLAVGLMNQGVSSDIQDALAAGDRPDAPHLELPILSTGDGVAPAGADLDLEELRGRVVVLNFWASWCPPCEAEAPLLEGVARGYRDRGEQVVVLGVDVEDLPASARKFIDKHGLTYPNVRDPSDATKLRYEVGSLPETFVIDPDGRIALKHIGQLTDPAQLTTAIDQLLDTPS